MGEPVLYDYWQSSSCYRVRIALNLIGLEYESRQVDIAGQAHQTPGYRAVHPQALVPVLDIDGHRLRQSLAIIEYLDETRSAGFLPADPAGRARVRALAMAIAMEILPVCGQRVAKAAAELSRGTIGMEGWMRHFLGPGLLAVEAMLPMAPGATCCCGETITLADIVLAPQLLNAARLGMDFSAMPRLRAIGGRLSETPAFVKAHPDTLRPVERW